MGRRRLPRRQRPHLSGVYSAEAWNATRPIGTPVRFWPVYPPIDSVPPVDTVTRSEAWALGDGSVVVLLAGRTGGCALTHIETIKEADRG